MLYASKNEAKKNVSVTCIAKQISGFMRLAEFCGLHISC